jgi:hypothetical protein
MLRGLVRLARRLSGRQPVHLAHDPIPLAWGRDRTLWGCAVGECSWYAWVDGHGAPAEVAA